jgi:single-strand DNA-binding protein
MSIVSVTIDGRLTKEPEVKSYGSDKKLTSVSIASNTGFGDNKKTLYFNCTAFGKTGEAIAKYVNKGDQIIISGGISQNKKDDKIFWNIIINDFSFGQKKNDGVGRVSNVPDEPEHGDNPFDDDDIPF